MKWEFFCITVLNIVAVTHSLGALDDPYKILGVKKSATVQELRKAYKKLAKEWHPDKNDDPRAASKFVEITQAYELLTDPDRKRQYDYRGTINPDSNYKKQNFHFDEFDPFDDIFNFPQGFKFTNRNPEMSTFYKFSITARAFENSLRPKSFITPYLIFFFSDWCLGCIKIEPVWKKIVEELEPIGVELATVHSSQEPLLAQKCGVGSIPALVLLIEGKVYPFKEALYSIQKIVDFVRNKFMYKLIMNVKDENMNSFLEGWHDNRIRALVFQKSEPVKLRYLLMAFYYRERVSFGFVRLSSSDTMEIQKKYKVSPEFDTLLLFNEDTNRPIASLSMPVIPVQTMKDVIFENKYLILPRLSSQKVLDSLCPVEWASRRKRLCVVLISQNTKEHDEPRQAMRQLAQESVYKSERVKFSYIYQEKQPEFVKSLLAGSPQETVLNIVILWRRDVSHLKYEWMQGSWKYDKASPEWNKTKEQLESIISKLLKTDETFTYEAVVKELIDEQAQSLLIKIFNKFFIAVDILKTGLHRDHVFAAASVLATIAFIFAGGYFMTCLARQEEEKIRCQMKPNGNANYIPELKLHELRYETYNGMVRMIKPGCRTIVLLLDQQSRNSLLPEFHAAVWPYRKNKTLAFGFMYIERGLEWFRRLLVLSLPVSRDLAINPRNCIGTVLSINGHRRYYCIYHAKHPEYFKDLGSKRLLKMAKNLRSDDQTGNFIGFEDSSDSDGDENVDVEQGARKVFKNNSRVIPQSSLLSEFPNWLDRLFEGSTFRYSVNYWPDFPKK